MGIKLLFRANWWGKTGTVIPRFTDIRVINVKFLLVISLLYKTETVMRIKDMITQDESN